MYNQDLYVLDGGIGKNICFTNCLAKLGKVNVMSTWPKVFTNNQNKYNFSRKSYTISVQIYKFSP